MAQNYLCQFLIGTTQESGFDMDNIGDRFAEMFLAARLAANMSQAQAAKAIGVSKTTIQAWENGTSSPSQRKGFEYFQQLGIQPLPYYLQIFYHTEFKNLKISSSDKEMDEALIAVIRDLPIETKKKILYVIYGDHGSSPAAVLDLIVAHLHTPLIARVGVAEMVRTNFELAQKLGRLVSPKNIMPDMDLLDISIKRAKAAVENRHKHYTTIG